VQVAEVTDNINFRSDRQYRFQKRQTI